MPSGSELEDVIRRVAMEMGVPELALDPRYVRVAAYALIASELAKGGEEPSPEEVARLVLRVRRRIEEDPPRPSNRAERRAARRRRRP